MKYILIALIAVWCPVVASAQEEDGPHFRYADVGISGAKFYPGFSFTYNYRPVKFLGIGIGTQVHAFFPTITSPHQYIPAVFGDLRITIRPRKISQYFIFVDYGIALYKHSKNTHYQDDVVYYVPDDNGTYGSFGIGYFLRLTHRGGGAYVTLNTMFNYYKMTAYNVILQEETTEKAGRGTTVLSFGFRF